MTTTHQPILASPIRAVIEAGRTLERHIEKAAPVQVATLLVLDELDQTPGATLPELAASLDLQKQTIHGVLARMLAGGLIEKQAVEKSPSSKYYLTVPGVELLDDCRDKLAPISAKLCAIVSSGRAPAFVAQALREWTP